MQTPRNRHALCSAALPDRTASRNKLLWMAGWSARAQRRLRRRLCVLGHRSGQTAVLGGRLCIRRIEISGYGAVGSPYLQPPSWLSKYVVHTYTWTNLMYAFDWL